MGFRSGSTVKNQPAMTETWLRSLGWGDPLEEGMATHSSVLAMENPMDRGAWQATVHRVAKSRRKRKQLSTCNTCVYIQLLHFSVRQKLTQHFKSTIFQ